MRKRKEIEQELLEHFKEDCDTSLIEQEILLDVRELLIKLTKNGGNK